MEIKKIFETVCKAITSAMGVAVVVLSIVTDLEENTAISLLGIGLACSGLVIMQANKNYSSPFLPHTYIMC